MTDLTPTLAPTLAPTPLEEPVTDSVVVTPELAATLTALEAADRAYAEADALITAARGAVVQACAADLAATEYGRTWQKADKAYRETRERLNALHRESNDVYRQAKDREEVVSKDYARASLAIAEGPRGDRKAARAEALAAYTAASEAAARTQAEWAELDAIRARTDGMQPEMEETRLRFNTAVSALQVAAMDRLPAGIRDRKYMVERVMTVIADLLRVHG